MASTVFIIFEIILKNNIKPRGSQVLPLCLTISLCFSLSHTHTCAHGIYMIQDALVRHTSWIVRINRAFLTQIKFTKGKNGVVLSWLASSRKWMISKRLACSIPFSLCVSQSHGCFWRTTWKSNWPLNLLKAVFRKLEPQRHDNENKLCKESILKSDFVLSL